MPATQLSRPPGDSADAPVARIAEFLRTGMNSPEFQPPLLPATAMQLFELSRDPDVSLISIRELMEQDPVIAAKVMSIAQSAYYSRGMPVESLEDALVRLGVKRLTSIFIETAMRVTVLGSKAFEKPLERLRRHGVATGHIARGLCQSLKLPPDRAFVCGLLHDIGIAACYLLLSKLPREQRPKQFETVAEAVRLVHEEASVTMAEKWELPHGIRWVVGHHHSLQVGGHTNPMTAIVSLADFLAAMSGADALGEADEREARKAARYFGLDDDDLSRLVDRSRKLVEQLP